MGATITLGVVSGVRLNQARDLTAQTKQIAAQTKATQTTNWCSSVRADNRADMGEIYNEYRTATDERRQAIDAECPNKVARREPDLHLHRGKMSSNSIRRAH